MEQAEMGNDMVCVHRKRMPLKLKTFDVLGVIDGGWLFVVAAAASPVIRSIAPRFPLPLRHTPG
jgi:hypothetical protein